LGDIAEEYVGTEMWHETNAVIEGSISRRTEFSDGLKGWILPGPHISAGNPYFKTPRSICKEKGIMTRLMPRSFQSSIIPELITCPLGTVRAIWLA
jgi:hypothetical protein